MKKIILTLLVGMSFNSFAHDERVVLGADVSEMKQIFITCESEGDILQDKLYLRLTSNAPANAPLISAQIAKGNFVTTVTDSINNDGNPSRAAEIKQGDGMYRVTVSKNGQGSGVVDAALEIHCISSVTGEHLPGGTLVSYP